jgi:hypothetical protein
MNLSIERLLNKERQAAELDDFWLAFLSLYVAGIAI